MNDDELKMLWQTQPATLENYSFDKLQRDANTFRRMIVRRQIQESIAALLVASIFGFYAWQLDDVFMRLGCGLVAIGSFFILYHLHSRASMRELAPERMALPFASYFREELLRQRNALRSVWLWLTPTMLGLSLFFWGMAQPKPAEFPWWIMSVIYVPVLVVIGMNFVAARKIQRKINQLDQLTES